MATRQQKPIEISNFLKMNPSVPQFSARNTNYLIAGANPISYLDDGSQEEQVAPLAASIDWAQITGTIEGNIVHMITSTKSTYDVYFITDTTRVYGATATTITDLGYITAGGAQNNTGGYLAISGVNLFATYSLGGVVYYMPLSSNAPGNWSYFISIQTSVGVHILEQFVNRVAISDGTSSFNQANIVKLIDPVGTPSILTTPQYNFGEGNGIYQMRNFNDKYLAIAIGRTTSGGFIGGYTQNFIYLWDGAQSSMNYTVKVPGKFIDMKVVDSVLYVAVKVSNSKTCVYYLNGTKLKKVFTTQYSTINTVNRSPVPCSLFDFKNYLGVKLDDTSEITRPIMVKGNDEQGDIEFIHSSGKSFENIAVGYSGYLYANEYVNNGNSVLYYLPTTQITNGTYQNILYKSQWIPCKNSSAIDVYYDTPPATGNDAINVTIYGQGEDYTDSTNQPVVTTLDPITPTNKLTNKRTRLDLKGFAGDQIMIKLTTVNSTWRPKINSIVII